MQSKKIVQGNSAVMMTKIMLPDKSRDECTKIMQAVSEICGRK